MQLLTVIHHPQSDIRPVRELVIELAGVYDRVMGQASQRHTTELSHTAVILLSWPCRDLGFPVWHEYSEGALATVGLPTMYCPPLGATDDDDESEMLTPARLAQLIAGRGDNADARLGYCGGMFAAAHVGHDRQVRIVTNYLSEVTIYRAENADNGLTVWSNKAAAAAMLTGVPLTLDQQAAREYLITRNAMEDRTLFEHVKTEPAGVCVRIDARQVARQPYINLPAEYFAHRHEPQAMVDHAVRSMKPLVDTLREYEHPARLHLSAGLDSRAALAVFQHHGYKPICRTFNAPNEEIPLASKLCKLAGCKHEVVGGDVPAAADFFAMVPQANWLSDGMMMLKYLAGRFDLQMIHEEGYLPIEGMGGEFARAYYYDDEKSLEKIAAGNFEKVYQKAIGGRGDLWPSPGGIDQIRQTIARLLDEPTDNPFQTGIWFYVNQRKRRWAAARRNSGWQWYIEPMQQPCWTYHGMSAVPEDRFDSGLISRFLETAWPGINKRVPTLPAWKAAARHRRIATNRIVRGYFKAYDAVRPKLPTHIQTRTLEALQPDLLQQIYEAEPLLPPMLTADTAKGWLQSRPLTYDQTELFWHAVTLAMWCRQFIGQDPAIGCALAEEHA